MSQGIQTIKALSASAGEKIVINGYINIAGDDNISFADGVKLSGVESFDSRAIATDGGYQSKISINSKAMMFLTAIMKFPILNSVVRHKTE